MAKPRVSRAIDFNTFDILVDNNSFNNNENKYPSKNITISSIVIE